MADITFGTTTANNILNALFNNTAFNFGSSVYMSLHTADPGATGANEVSGGSYARLDVSSDWPAAASKTLDNDNVLTHPDLPAVSITYVGFWTASTGGTFMLGFATSATIVVGSGGSAEFAAGEVDITLP